jgi:ribose transport system ATP-binding protein
VDNVDLDVRPGEIHALVGENGAGKSTLIKMLAGVYIPDGGEMWFDGRQVHPSSERLPISFIHQDLGLVASMTVAENVALVAGYPRPLGLISWSAARKQAAQALETMGSGIDPEATVANLAAAERSLVAIARAMAIESDVLVLDEPTASLAAADVSRLFDALHHLRARGVGMIYFPTAMTFNSIVNEQVSSALLATSGSRPTTTSSTTASCGVSRGPAFLRG